MKKGDQARAFHDVQSYYDRTNDAYLKCMGTTLQASFIKADDEISARKSNIQLAKKADILRGDFVLDAGCGVCGPSIDIASEIPDLHIEAITASFQQSLTAKNLIKHACLSHAISVRICDYHFLPYINCYFDKVYFFESFSHSYNRKQALSEVFRVLKPGGKLYIKDIFLSNVSFTIDDQIALNEATMIYALSPSTIEIARDDILQAGFVNVTMQSIMDKVSTEHWSQAMVRKQGNETMLTELGKLHFRSTMGYELPHFYGELKALKP